MSTETILISLKEAMVDLDDAGAVDLTRVLLEKKVEPVDILTACEQALASIGERYAAGEYFISGLIMAGEVMSRIVDMVTPCLTAPLTEVTLGRVLVGTVEGDIHDLGKNIAAALLSVHGFEVRDLGVDVPAEDFVRECGQFKPDIIGLSALLTTCFPALEKTVAELKTFRGESGRPAIFISGAMITPDHRDLYKADYQADTAFDTVRLCKEILRKKTESA